MIEKLRIALLTLFLCAVPGAGWAADSGDTATSEALTWSDFGFVLQAPSSGAFSGGVGAATLDLDGDGYVLYFESPASSTEVPEDCSSQYRIGRATSPDGFTWTIDEEPALVPEDDTSYNCSVSQPAVLFDGREWHLFFSMAESSSGSNYSSGIGWATSPDGVDFTVQQAPLIARNDDTNTSFASAALVDGVIYLTWAEAPYLKLATLDVDAGDDWVLAED
ncbi:MAG: hypothetical protein QGG40_18195, partial [Myxococcota bacterium]|nr:hypothetical protein [Myxococcota bacterium]